MNQLSCPWALVAVAGALCLIGCSHKRDSATELEKTAHLLATTDAAKPTPAPAPGLQPPTPVPSAATAAPSAAPAPTASQQMQQALASYRAGDLEDAVTRLQKLRATPALTPQQRMAVQDSVAAVMVEVYGLAAKGDARAIQAVKQYEQMQTQAR